MVSSKALSIREKIEAKYPKAEIDRVFFGGGSLNYQKYQDDPVGFGQDVLGEAYTDEVKAMMESVRDNRITVAMSSNATGKSHGAARVAIWFYKSFQDAQVWTAAAPPLSNLTNILWGEINDIALIKHPELFEKDEISSLSVKRAPLDFIKGQTIPSSGTSAEKVAKFSGKHRPHLLFIVDEGDAVPDEVYEGIETCMSGGTMVRLLIMFNPRARSGEVYRMIRDGRANVVPLKAFNHPNVVTGENVIPGAVTRFETPGLSVPHIGWNQLRDCKPSGVWENNKASRFYFVHSFRVLGTEVPSSLVFTLTNSPLSCAFFHIPRLLLFSGQSRMAFITH